MSLEFDASESAWFDSRWDGKVRLSRRTWEGHIIARPERAQLKFNSDKIARTLAAPDTARESKADGPETHLYYKRFDRWCISELIEIPIHPQMRHLVVVVGTKEKLIKTIYMTGRIKLGRML